jgi:hypothetical protein
MEANNSEALSEIIIHDIKSLDISSTAIGSVKDKILALKRRREKIL